MEEFVRFRDTLFTSARRDFDGIDHILRKEFARQNESYQRELQILRKEVDFLGKKVATLDELELELEPPRAQRSALKFDSTSRLCAISLLQDSSRHSHSSSTFDKKLEQEAELEPYRNIRSYIFESAKEVYNLKKAKDYWQGKAIRWSRRHKKWAAGPSDAKHEKPYRPLQTNMPVDTVLQTSKSTASPTIEVFGIPKQGTVVRCGPRQTTHLPQSVPERMWDIGQNIPLDVSMKESAEFSRNKIHAHVHVPPDEGCQSIDNMATAKCEEISNAPKTSNSVEPRPEFLQAFLSTELSFDEQTQYLQHENFEDCSKLINVSERCLKRKRVSVAQNPKSSDNTNEHLLVKGEIGSEVKIELSSSSPITPNSLHLLKAHDGVDLDELTGNLHTPRRSTSRKRQIDQQQGSLFSLVSLSDSNSNNEVCIDKQRNISATGNGSHDQSNRDGNRSAEIPEVYNGSHYTRQGEHFSNRVRQKKQAQDKALLLSENRLSDDCQLSKYAPFRDDPCTVQSDHPSKNYDIPEHANFERVLRPADSNKRILPRSGSLPGTREMLGQVSREHQSHVHIQSIAEDGDNRPGSQGEINHFAEKPPLNSISNFCLATAENEKAQGFQNRLQNLMSEPSPDKLPLEDRGFCINPSRSIQNSKPLAIIDLPNKQPRKHLNPHQDKSMSPSVSKLKAAEQKHKTPGSTKATYTSPFARPRNESPSKAHSPLRNRLLSDLHLDDFKINAKHNQGYEYPFKDVIRERERDRERDQRKHLPGCTNLECCGALFRKMAEIGTVKSTKANAGRSMSSLTREDDEKESMLQDYLGDQRQRLDAMSCDEKAELLLQGKARVLAEHDSRHRQAYAREPSPVGFWDVEMPNTQEVDELGKAAELRTRLKVEERYREAMRPDGLWKFKDE